MELVVAIVVVEAIVVGFISFLVEYVAVEGIMLVTVEPVLVKVVFVVVVAVVSVVIAIVEPMSVEIIFAVVNGDFVVV